MTAPVLRVEDLSVAFHTRNGVVRALDRINFAVDAGQTMALVGESGSGKSVTAYAIMGLLEEAGKITGGRALLSGTDLVACSPRALSRIRGRRIAMIFQNPRAALNPIRAVGRQIADVLLRHGGATAANAKQRAIEALQAVGIPDPARRANAYPFELSGGMCQRVMIAIAVAARPELLIADEPTTGLDVTTQAVVMDLIQAMAAETGMATILITHDLALAAERASRIAVMHAGHMVEDCDTATLLAQPRHPYTARLIAATPSATGRLEALQSVPGGLPDLRRNDLPPCRYAARCERRAEACDRVITMRDIAPHHRIGCWNPLEQAA
ncbi:MAG: ABC transporter ATP-binding protein [Acetobacteraceae bacterium]|nr:ABC transporter ATP-binding protein [Pseudomonadota bacterium]